MHTHRLFRRAGGFVLAVLVAASGAQAQTRLSLTEALELGLKNRHDVQADAVEAALTENALRKNRQTWLPTLTASGNVRYNTQLQTTVLPAGAFPGVTESQVLAFGTRNSTLLALDLAQPLLRPEAAIDRAIVRNTGALDAEKVRQRRTDVQVKIAEAYLNVLLKDLQRTLARADAARYRQYLEVADGQHRLGTLPEADFLTARLNDQNGSLTVQKTEQAYRAAQATFCYQLNIEPDTTLVLTDRLDPSSLATADLPAANPVAERPELRQLRLQREGHALQERKVLAGLRPTLSLYGNYSVQFLANNFKYFQNRWFPFNYLGLNLSVPLSGQFTRRANLQTHRLQARQTELTLRQTEADIAHEIQQAARDLDAARNTLQTTQGSFELARQLAALQLEQYRLGTVRYTQLLDAEGSLQTAQQRYLEAAYAYLVARLNHEKARGAFSTEK